MGSELSAVSDCTLTEPYQTSSKFFTVYNGNNRDGTDVSVFVCTEDTVNPDISSNAIKVINVF